MEGDIQMFRIAMATAAIMVASASINTALAYNEECADPRKAAILIEKNKETLGRKLRDPTPVYSGMYVSCKSGAPMVCGLVNARNGYGGYTGQQRWIGALFDAFTEEGLKGNFQRFWEKHCSQ